MMDHFHRLPVISTDRLTLREMTSADTDALFEIYSDPEVMRYWSSPPLRERSEAEALLQRIQQSVHDGNACAWGIERTSDNRFMGTCTIHHIDSGNRRAEIGYALGSAYQKQGYMREALTAVFDYAFHVMNLHRMEADIDPRNTASARILERLGFQKEGYLRERWIVNGEISDSTLYGLLTKEWSPSAENKGEMSL
jgi:hypothetical protein